jgi:hypothetical protein
MPDLLSFVQQVGANNYSRSVKCAVDRVFVYPNLIGVFSGVTFSLFAGYPPVVYEDKIEVYFGRVFPDGLKMLPGGVTVSFARLGHEIANEDLSRVSLADCPSHVRHKQIWQDAGVERAGAHGDYVRLPDRSEHLRQR